MVRLSCVLLLLGLCLLPGCGGGSSRQTTKTTLVKLSIAWGAHSRALNAPSSALSAILTLANADPSGGDFTYTISRAPTPGAYVGDYVITRPTKIGATNLTLRFLAESNGTGAVVGIAQAPVTLQTDGTGIGNISTTNTIQKVTVPAGQTIRVGQTKDLIFTAQDLQGNIVAVTPGSGFFSVGDGNDKLQIVNGQAKGMAVGTATVNVAVDGKTSGNTEVMVYLTPTAYAITDLGTLPGDTEAYAQSINAQGDIVGVSSRVENFNFVQRVVVWKNGSILDTGLALTNNGYRFLDINNADQVICNVGSHSYLWQNGTAADLGTMGGDLLVAEDINNQGVIIGFGTVPNPDSNPNPPVHGFLWQNGAFTDLGTDFFPTALNDSGIIAGDIKVADSDQHPARLQNGSVTDLGVFVNDFSGGTSAINAAGHIIGASGNGDSHGFVWKDGRLLDLEGKLSRITYFSHTYTDPAAINDFDQIVGEQHSGIPVVPNKYTAFLYSEGKFIDLQTLLPPNSGWTLITANGINNNGQIVGAGTVNGSRHAFLMTPQ